MAEQHERNDRFYTLFLELSAFNNHVRRGHHGVFLSLVEDLAIVPLLEEEYHQASLETRIINIQQFICEWRRLLVLERRQPIRVDHYYIQFILSVLDYFKNEFLSIRSKN